MVDILEKDGRGLNLTFEVRDGILNHSKEEGDILGRGAGRLSTLEGEVLRISDAIAYINHDIGDAIRAGILGEDDLPLGPISVLGRFHSQRVHTMVSDVIEHSWAVSGNVTTEQPAIGMSPRVLEATNKLRDFLFERVYHNVRSVQDKQTWAREIVRKLYGYFCQHEDKLPLEYRYPGDEPQRRVVDYIAGMTDQYAIRLAEELLRIKRGVAAS